MSTALFHCSLTYVEVRLSMLIFYELFHKQALYFPEFTSLLMPFQNRTPLYPHLFINILPTLKTQLKSKLSKKSSPGVPAGTKLSLLCTSTDFCLYSIITPNTFHIRPEFFGYMATSFLIINC